MSGWPARPRMHSRSGVIETTAQLRHMRKRLTRRSQISIATVFTPMNPNETPEEHFPLQTVYTRTPHPRFVNRYDSREILLVVDGSCANNGSTELQSTGGCSFTYKGAGESGFTVTFPFSDGGRDAGGTVGFPLEERGPDGEYYAASSNRAKLRAVIAGLQFREWQEEGWRRIVVATDLEYVVFGATRWLALWVKRRWRNRRAQHIANRDLWEELHGAIARLAGLGTEVSFWLVPSRGMIKQTSALVQDTKDVAREAARIHFDSAAEEFSRLCGIEV
ncbi:hypothetical protein F4777DRAFT_388732 [Nemania sp. FL0916]|nr:hypothetical protein F4777DRAFT_388732 [Nemania sp. FL0916]